MLFVMFSGSKRMAAWLRTAPLLASLWLVSMLCGPVPVWTHADETPCFTCPIALTAPLEACCENDKFAAFQKEIGVAAPNDCHECCEASAPDAPVSTLWPSSSPAILGARYENRLPALRETRVIYAFKTRFWNEFGRPPPRGRGPPLGFSISPL